MRFVKLVFSFYVGGIVGTTLTAKLMRKPSEKLVSLSISSKFHSTDANS